MMKVLWKEKINNWLDNFEKLVIIGVGNKDRCDDGSGSAITEILSDFAERNRIGNVRIFSCYEAPENFTGPVKKEKPSHIIIIDSCITGQKPGHISIIKPDRIKETDISSHRMPLKLLCEYLRDETGADILIIGVEPYNIKEGSNFSDPVNKSIQKVNDFFKEVLRFRQAGRVD
ncbi:MAG TPA: hydrogenase 3 maturation endopeptidase HyCI [bacterium]|nr:hydrogenase 3 maturation endopeptidase HyCI [bacterium]